MPVIAAEDMRFYQHHGFDWHAMQIAAGDDMEGGRIRGGSTLTQQLIKICSSEPAAPFFRKGAEFTLVPVAEVVLGKQRILELYLNEVGMGPRSLWSGGGVQLPLPSLSPEYRPGTRARLAAILPLPLKRRPEHMNRYSGLIQERMLQLGW